MTTATQGLARREPALFFRRMEAKLGMVALNSDGDIARVVEDRLPLSAVDSLTRHGLSTDEIYRYISSRRTLAERRKDDKLDG